MRKYYDKHYKDKEINLHVTSSKTYMKVTHHIN